MSNQGVDSYLGLDQCCAGMLIGDWVDIGIFGVLALTLCYTALSYRRQAWSLDYSSYLGLMTSFSDAWRRFRAFDKEDKEEKSYELFELLGLIEDSCLLWRCGVFKGAPKKMLHANLKEYVGEISRNEYVRHHIHEGVSGPETFIEIERFAKKHGIKFPALEEARARNAPNS